MARLWHTAILSKWKPVFGFIPIESQIEKVQEQYYNVIAKCHVDGEATSFIEFMLSQIDKILDDISTQISEENEQLSEYLKRMLDVMEYDIPYTSKAIMGKLGLKSKEGFRRNYLRPAIDMNLIRIPCENYNDILQIMQKAKAEASQSETSSEETEQSEAVLGAGGAGGSSESEEETTTEIVVINGATYLETTTVVNGITSTQRTVISDQSTEKDHEV